MVRKNGAETRRQRIQEIAKRVLAWLQERGGEMSYTKTVSALAYETGLTKEKIEEYLSILEDLGRFVIDKKTDTIRRANESAEP